MRATETKSWQLRLTAQRQRRQHPADFQPSSALLDLMQSSVGDVAFLLFTFLRAPCQVFGVDAEVLKLFKHWRKVCVEVMQKAGTISVSVTWGSEARASASDQSVGFCSMRGQSSRIVSSGFCDCEILAEHPFGPGYLRQVHATSFERLCRSSLVLMATSPRQGGRAPADPDRRGRDPVGKTR